MKFFTISNYTILIALRQEDNNLESSEVVQELELAINLVLYVFCLFVFSMKFRQQIYRRKLVVSILNINRHLQAKWLLWPTTMDIAFYEVS